MNELLVSRRKPNSTRPLVKAHTKPIKMLKATDKRKSGYSLTTSSKADNDGKEEVAGEVTWKRKGEEEGGTAGVPQDFRREQRPSQKA